MANKPTWLRTQIREHGGSRTLANHLRVTRQAVDFWASGHNKPSDEHAAQLADWLGVPELVLRQHLRMPVYNDHGVVLSAALADLRGYQRAYAEIATAAERAADRIGVELAQLDQALTS